jgi:hypothetical protein
MCALELYTIALEEGGGDEEFAAGVATIKSFHLNEANYTSSRDSMEAVMVRGYRSGTFLCWVHAIYVACSRGVG